MTSVRPAGGDDLTAIATQYADLHREQWTASPQLRPDGDREPDWPGEVRAALDDPAAHLFVAEADGQLIGTVRVEFAERPFFRIAEVHRLYVRPEWRRRGVASELMRVAEATAREGGAAEVRLTVLAGNEAALRFYRIGQYHHFATRLAKRLG
jgi:ribosomal protein S18 acetylase RimI-like enzyme